MRNFFESWLLKTRIGPSQTHESERWWCLVQVILPLGITRDTIYPRGSSTSRYVPIRSRHGIQVDEVDAWVRRGEAADGEPSSEKR